MLDGRGDPAEPAHRTQADIEIKPLAQGDVERTDATPDRGRERALDADAVVAESLHRLLGQVGPQFVIGFLSGRDFQPVEPARSAVSLLHRSVQNAAHRRGDLGAYAVAGNIGNCAADHFVRVLSAEPARNQAICCAV